MLRFLDQGATFAVPPDFVDRTVHTITADGGRRIVCRRCSEDCRSSATCLDSTLERLQRTLGTGLTVRSRSVLRAATGEVETAELTAEILGQALWTQLVSGTNGEGCWLMQISAPESAPALVEGILATLCDTKRFVPPAASPRASCWRFFCGSICFEVPSDYSGPSSTILEGKIGALHLRLAGSGPTPEDAFYSDPPLELLERRESRVDTSWGRIPVTQQAVRAFTPKGPNEQLHLSAALSLPDRAALSVVGTGDRSCQGALDRSFRELLLSVKIVGKNG